MNWFDIGVNLTDERLPLEPVLKRALDANVRHMLITGTTVTGSQNAAELASQHPQQLYSTAGIHPHYAKDVDENYLDALRKLAFKTQVVAIGECGLDFNRNFSPPEQQLAVFEQQLRLACELELPVFLHERDAFEPQIQLLKKYRPSLVGGVAHCFTGDKEQMLKYLELDLFVGVTGWVCDLKRGQALRDAVSELPLERVLLETDAPYLWPRTLRREKGSGVSNNEPCNLPHVAEQLADLMSTDIDSLKRHSFANSCQLFNIPG